MVVSKSFLQSKRELLKRFLRGWIEGIKSARTDKELTVKVLQRFLKTADREILDRTFEVYKDVQEKIPAPDAKVMAVALKQLAATVLPSRVETAPVGQLVRKNACHWLPHACGSWQSLQGSLSPFLNAAVPPSGSVYLK